MKKAFLLIMLAGLVVGIAVAYRNAARILQAQVVAALGPEASVGGVGLSGLSVVVTDLRLRAPRDWPARDTLRTARVEVRPSLRSLLGGEIRIARISVEQPYLSVFRTRDGKLRLLPSLLEKAPAAPASGGAAPAIVLDHIEIKDGVVEFYDDSLGARPVLIRAQDVRVGVDDLHLPALDSHTNVDVEATLAGKDAGHDGRFKLAGWAQLGNLDSELETSMQSVDLRVLEPYLLRAAETGVRSGTLDLSLKTQIRRRQLHAPGKVTLNGLELAPSDRPMATFMGMPRAAVITVLKGRDGRIAVPFELAGDLDNPQFSFNAALASRVGFAMAQSLGLGIADVAVKLGSFGVDTVKAAGGALGKLFGGKK